MKQLDRINDIDDIKKLNISEKKELAQEIRHFLIKKEDVSQEKRPFMATPHPPFKYGKKPEFFTAFIYYNRKRGGHMRQTAGQKKANCTYKRYKRKEIGKPNI